MPSASSSRTDPPAATAPRTSAVAVPAPAGCRDDALPVGVRDGMTKESPPPPVNDPPPPSPAGHLRRVDRRHEPGRTHDPLPASPPQSRLDRKRRPSTHSRAIETFAGPECDLQPASRQPPAQARGESGEPEGWLYLQATDLIARLQAWSCELAERESTIIARSATQDQRERQWRIRRHTFDAKIENRLRAAKRLLGETEAVIRRLTQGERLPTTDSPTGESGQAESAPAAVDSSDVTTSGRRVGPVSRPGPRRRPTFIG